MKQKKSNKIISLMAAGIIMILFCLTNYGVFKADDVLESQTTTSAQEQNETVPPPQVKAPDKVKMSEVEQLYNTTKLKVSWNKVNNANGYQLYRKTGKSNWKQLKTTTATSVTDKSTKKSRKYSYKVRAYKIDSGKKVYGNYSSTVTTTVVAKSSTIAKTKVSSIKQSGTKKWVKETYMDHDTSYYQLKKAAATVKWKKVKNAAKYQVYKKAGKNGTWKRVATTKKLSFVDKSVKVDKVYYYKIRAIKIYKGKNYYGGYSSEKKVTMKLYKIYGIKYDPDEVIETVKKMAAKNYPKITYDNYPIEYVKLYKKGEMSKEDYDIYKSCDSNKDGILTIQEDGAGYYADAVSNTWTTKQAIKSLYWSFEYSVVGVRYSKIPTTYLRDNYSMSWRLWNSGGNVNEPCVAFYIWR